ncbi:MAG: hypothetical protein M1813_004164 [Trichoglossum hirsutum]|nr:MAG: hypothetical protein M1813_004164 [Trichoglossum hirsutum]
MPSHQARTQASHEILIRILQTAHAISSSHNLGKLLSLLENTGTFEPDAKRSLLIIIGKLRRYAIQVEIIDLCPPLPNAFKEDVCSSTGILGQYLQNLQTTAVRGLERKLGKTLSALQRALKDRINQGSYKVHAEIQLLCYSLRSSPDDQHKPPRIISSSKSACFLCDLFVKLHRRFHIARTHGVLYDKWTPLDFSVIQFASVERRQELIDTIQRFDAAIRKKIEVFMNSRQSKLLHLNESVFFPLPELTPSVRSIATELGEDDGVIGLSAALGAQPATQSYPEMPSKDSLMASPPVQRNLYFRRCLTSTARTSPSGTAVSAHISGKPPSTIRRKSSLPVSEHALRPCSSGETIKGGKIRGGQDPVGEEFVTPATVHDIRVQTPVGGTIDATGTPPLNANRSVCPSFTIGLPTRGNNDPKPVVDPTTITPTSWSAVGDSPRPTEKLTQGQTAWWHLSTQALSPRVATRHICLSLTAHDWMTDPDTYHRSFECWARTKWLTADEVTKLGDESVVRVDWGEEKTVDRGAVWSGRELFVGVKGDVVCVKYELEESSGSIGGSQL